MKTKRGFTLIELMVVVLILACLAAIIVPKFAKQETEQEGLDTVAVEHTTIAEASCLTIRIEGTTEDGTSYKLAQGPAGYQWNPNTEAYYCRIIIWNPERTKREGVYFEYGDYGMWLGVSSCSNDYYVMNDMSGASSLTYRADANKPEVEGSWGKVIPSKQDAFERANRLAYYGQHAILSQAAHISIGGDLAQLKTGF